MCIDQDMIDEIIDRITALLPVDRIILFGSAATCEFGEDSDLDLLLLIPDGENSRPISIRVRDALRGLGLPVDIVVMSTDRFEETKDIIGGVAHPANAYGEVLYDVA